MLEYLGNMVDEVVDEEASNDADFKRVWDYLQEFRANWQIWGDLGYLD